MCVCEGARVALLTQHATHMRHIVSSFVASLTGPHFPALSHKRHDFREKKVIERKMCSLILSANASKTFLIISRIERNIVINTKTSLFMSVQDRFFHPLVSRHTDYVIPAHKTKYCYIESIFILIKHGQKSKSLKSKTARTTKT